MITAKCWVCRDRKHGVLYCNKCADSMERKAKAWDALVDYIGKRVARPDLNVREHDDILIGRKARFLLIELENDDGKDARD